MTAPADEMPTTPGRRSLPAQPAAGLLFRPGCSVLVDLPEAGQLVAIRRGRRHRTSPSAVRPGHGRRRRRGPDRRRGQDQVWTLREQSDIAPAIEPAGRSTAAGCRASSVVTGCHLCHGWPGGRRTAAGRTSGSSTPLFSCLAGSTAALQLRAAVAAAVRLPLAARGPLSTSTAWRCGTAARVRDRDGQRRAQVAGRRTCNDNGAVLDVPSGESSRPGCPCRTPAVATAGCGPELRIRPGSSTSTSPAGRGVVRVPRLRPGLAFHAGSRSSASPDPETSHVRRRADRRPT